MYPYKKQNDCDPFMYRWSEGTSGITLAHRGLLRPATFIIIKTPFPSSQWWTSLRSGITERKKPGPRRAGPESACSRGFGLQSKGQRQLGNNPHHLYVSNPHHSSRPTSNVTFNLLSSWFLQTEVFSPFFKLPKDLMCPCMMRCIITQPGLYLHIVVYLIIIYWVLATDCKLLKVIIYGSLLRSGTTVYSFLSLSRP